MSGVCTSCGVVTDIVQVGINYNCSACLFRAVSAGSLAVGEVGETTCDQCGDCITLGSEQTYCRNCAMCGECSDAIAQNCESHATSCSECGDYIETSSTAYCYSCGSHDNCHDDCMIESCYQCGDYAGAETLLCDRHRENSAVCSECNDSGVVLACRECANDLWFAGAVPMAVINDDGGITVDGVEIQWQ